MKKRLISLFLSAVMCVGVTGAYAHVTEGADALALKSGSRLLLDSDNSILSRIISGTTKAQLLAELDSADGAEVTKNGSALADGDAVTTGSVLTVEGKSYDLAVNGDPNGDGKINLSDVAAMLKSIARWDIEMSETAADANLDQKFNLADVALLMKHIAGWDVYVGAYDVTYSDEKLTADNEDKGLALSVMDNMQKIDNRDSDIGDSSTIRMQLSRNEIESCQVYLASDGGHEDLTVSFTEFGNGIGGTIETEMTMHYYVSTESVDDPSVQVMYPDALIPLSQFDIKDGYSQGFLLKLKPSEDTAPGLYMSNVTFRDASGKAVKVCKIYADVWDLTLPEESSCATAFGLSWYGVYTTHRKLEGDDGELYANYYEYMLENRISAYHLPYEFDDPRFEDYLNDPRVSAFCVDGCQTNFDKLTDEELADLYEKYGDNENWNKKAYFYYVDEPRNEENIAELKAAHERLEKLFPGSRHVTPIVRNPWYGDKDQVEVVSELTNLWCPISCFYTPEEYADDRTFLDETYSTSLGSAAINKYGTAEERFSAYKAAGDELWWYVCVVPQAPFANFFTNYQGEASRALFWQQYMYDIDGCLYWSVNYWNNGAEWRTSDNDFYSGDGLLLYAGHRYGVYGPIGSLRMEYIRDGIEDFEYLTMAEELCGKEAVDTVLATVTTGILDYTDDSKVIEAAKAKLAEMIMAAKAE